MCANAGIWPITLIHLGAQCLVELFSIIGLDTMKRPNDSHETMMMLDKKVMMLDNALYSFMLRRVGFRIQFRFSNLSLEQ